MLKSHSIYIRIWNSYTCFAELVHESFWYNNMHCTIDFCTDQPGRNPMYQSLSADMVLLSNLCSMVLGLIHPTFFKTSNHVGESTNICNSVLEFLRHRKSSIKIFGKLASILEYSIVHGPLLLDRLVNQNTFRYPRYVA